MFLRAIVLASQMATAAAAATPQQPAEAADAPTTAEQLGLGEEVSLDLPDASSELTGDVDRWVLHDVLSSGLAHSRAVRETRAGDGAATPVPPGWQDALMRARLHARLRGQPEQHHPQDLARLQSDIPLADHPLVDLYIDYFTGRGRLFFERWLARASRFRPMMEGILAGRGLPQDLVFVAMVESGFSARAVSSARAVGFWQFMPSTGRLYGLQHNAWVDERRDFVRATEAAASYLAQLYAQTGDWHLAWASYNAGEGRIRRALAKSGTTNFWELIEARHGLAKETVHYVPKVIAATIIAKNASHYGFAQVEHLPPLVYDEIFVEQAVDLRRLAARTGAALETLRELNPALLHDITPPQKKSRLRVPLGRGDELAQRIASMPPAQRLTFWQHRVRPGDTLSGIARLYRTDMRAIAEMNKLPKSNFLRAGASLVVPALPPSGKGQLAQASKQATPRRRQVLPPKLRPAEGASLARHTVAAGDTLWSIARRYGVTVERLRATNTVRGARRLSVGDVLDIF